MEDLTIENAKKLKGLKIKWRAPIYEGNFGYYGRGLDGGIIIIKDVNEKKRNPIVAEIIEGGDANSIFNEWGAGLKINKPLCFSDGDRFVSYEILN